MGSLILSHVDPPKVISGSQTNSSLLIFIISDYQRSSAVSSESIRLSRSSPRTVSPKRSFRTASTALVAGVCGDDRLHCRIARSGRVTRLMKSSMTARPRRRVSRSACLRGDLLFEALAIVGLEIREKRGARRIKPQPFALPDEPFAFLRVVVGAQCFGAGGPRFDFSIGLRNPV
jgi:hypothetical protein